MELKEVEEAMKADEKLQQQVIDNVLASDKGKSIIKKAQDTAIENGVEAIINTKIGETHQKYENDVKELFGIDKEDGEKGYQYLKRAGGITKDKISELETKVAEGSGDKELVGRYESLKGDYDKLKNQAQVDNDTSIKKMSELNSTIKRNAINVEVQKAVSKLTFKEDLPEYSKMFIDAEVDKIVKSAEIVDENIVYKDAEGKTIIDGQYNTMPIEDIVKSKLSEIIDSGDGKKGGNGGKPVQKLVSKDGKLTIDLGEVKTQSEATDLVDEQCRANGITLGSKDWNDLRDEVKEKTKDLPRI